MSELKSKEVPMLFKGQMVRALIRTLNPKTETRRILPPHPPLDLSHASVDVDDRGCISFWSDNRTQAGIYHMATVKVRPCDTIWVKETFATKIRNVGGTPHEALAYKADNSNENTCFDCNGKGYPVKWTPSLFMPRHASRILLEVTEKVRIERLQDISEKSALAEGFIKLPATGRVVEFEGAQYFGAYWPNARAAYRDLWNDINLAPKPISKNKITVGYTSYPWSNTDFDAEYPGIRESSLYRGKPITVTENPWVTVTTFKLKELRA